MDSEIQQHFAAARAAQRSGAALVPDVLSPQHADPWMAAAQPWQFFEGVQKYSKGTADLGSGKTGIPSVCDRGKHTECPGHAKSDALCIRSETKCMDTSDIASGLKRLDELAQQEYGATFGAATNTPNDELTVRRIARITGIEMKYPFATPADIAGPSETGARRQWLFKEDLVAADGSSTPVLEQLRGNASYDFTKSVLPICAERFETRTQCTCAFAFFRSANSANQFCTTRIVSGGTGPTGSIITNFLPSAATSYDASGNGQSKLGWENSLRAALMEKVRFVELATAKSAS